MTISKKNFSNFAPGTIPADTEYVFCNFTQRVPDTTGANPVGVEMFPGYSGPAMTFRNCNLVNCKVPAGSVIENCNTTISEYDVFDRDETITVDSVVVNTRTFTKQVIRGRFNPDTESYEYHPSPIDIPE
jgi:hypothetical protein